MEIFLEYNEVVMNIIDNGKTIEFEADGKTPKKRARDKTKGYIGGLGYGTYWEGRVSKELNVHIKKYQLSEGTRTELRIPLDKMPPEFYINKDEYIVLADNDVIESWDRETVRSVEKNEALGKAFRNRWAFVDVGYIIGQMLILTQEHKLQNPKDILIPLLKKHIRSRDGEAEILLEGFNIDGIEEMREGQTIAGLSLPVTRNGTPFCKLVYNLQGGETAIQMKDGKNVYARVDTVISQPKTRQTYLAVPDLSRGGWVTIHPALRYWTVRGLESDEDIRAMNTDIFHEGGLRGLVRSMEDTRQPGYNIKHFLLFDRQGKMRAAYQVPDNREEAVVRTPVGLQKRVVAKVSGNFAVHPDYSRTGSKRVMDETGQPVSIGSNFFQYAEDEWLRQGVGLLLGQSIVEGRAGFWDRTGGMAPTGDRVALEASDTLRNKDLEARYTDLNRRFCRRIFDLKPYTSSATDENIRAALTDIASNPSADLFTNSAARVIYENLFRIEDMSLTFERFARIIHTNGLSGDLLVKTLTRVIQTDPSLMEIINLRRKELDTQAGSLTVMNIVDQAVAKIKQTPVQKFTAKYQETNRAIESDMSKSETATNFQDIISYIQAQPQAQPLIVALGTSWIKGYEKGRYLQYDALNPLIGSLRSYCEARGILFIVNDDDKLLPCINTERAKDGKANAKVVVLAGENTVKSDDFATLRNDEQNAVVVGVNNQELTTDSYIRLIEMLTIALKLSAGLEVSLDNDHMTITKDNEHHIYIFLPHAEPMDYEQLKIIYEVQKFA